jgi:antitoxin CptB
MLQATEGKLQRLKGKDMEDVSEIKSQTELNRLRWRSRRGMAELDVLFVPFFEEAFDALSADMKEVYARMLDEEDPELWSWFSEQSAPDDPQYRSLVSLMLSRVRPIDT